MAKQSKDETPDNAVALKIPSDEEFRYPDGVPLNVPSDPVTDTGQSGRTAANTKEK